MSTITLEQIKAKLTESRDKTAKQVTDTWINKTAERLFSKVNDETVLDELLSDSVYFLESTQLTINSVLASEAKKIEEKYKDYTPPKKNETQTVTDPPKFELPDEYKSLLDSLKQEQNAKAIQQRKDKIFEVAKSKVSENQRNAFKRIIELENFNDSDSDDVIIERVMTSFTALSKDFIGEEGSPAKPTGTPKTAEEIGKTYKEIAERNHII